MSIWTRMGQECGTLKPHPKLEKTQQLALVLHTRQLHKRVTLGQTDQVDIKIRQNNKNRAKHLKCGQHTNFWWVETRSERKITTIRPYRSVQIETTQEVSRRSSLWRQTALDACQLCLIICNRIETIQSRKPVF